MAAAVLATSLCLLIPSAASAAQPILGITATDAIVGATIEASANLSESPNADGEISFAVFGPGDTDCSTPLTPAPASATASGEGQYSSGTFTASTAGTYRWSAHYAGDAENAPADATCAAISTVSKASPGISGSASSAIVGGTIDDEATVTGGFTPSGTVTFSVFAPGDSGCSTPLQSGAAPLQSGLAVSAGLVTQQAGNFRWTAEYSGDANNEAVSTPCNAANQTSPVGKATPGLTGTAGSGQVGATITDSATLAGGFAPGGQLVFRAYGPGDETCTDTPAYQATVAVSGNGAYAPAGFAPGPGIYRWRVTYAGDANNETVSTACNAANQSSLLNKAVPALTGVATSVPNTGLTITDNVTLSGGFSAGGQLVFRAYGPGDESCATVPAYEETVAVSGDGSYAPAGFAPPPGLYRWTVSYSGDANNEALTTACNADDQSSAVGMIALALSAGADNGTVGGPITATATLANGAIPTGQVTFKAFSPGDTSCSGAVAFSSTIAVSGNGSYRSAPFVPVRIGAYRWTVDYSGDVNHAAATAGCGQAASAVTKAQPTIVGKVRQKVTVGTAFRDTATLLGGFTAGGTVTFRIYGPVAAGCAKPVFVNTVAINGNGTVQSDPFVAQRPGRYSFVASYSGDPKNQAVSEPCDAPGQAALVQKRAPKVKPRARLIGAKLISIRASLSGSASPSGLVNFRLYGPGDKRCKGKPAFSGGITVRSNGSFSLAKYLATRPGVYRLAVGYSGDPRNLRYSGGCGGAQTIRVG